MIGPTASTCIGCCFQVRRVDFYARLTGQTHFCTHPGAACRAQDNQPGAPLGNTDDCPDWCPATQHDRSPFVRLVHWIGG